MLLNSEYFRKLIVTYENRVVFRSPVPKATRRLSRADCEGLKSGLSSVVGASGCKNVRSLFQWMSQPVAPLTMKKVTIRP
jgi:hypothetical protein